MPRVSIPYRPQPSREDASTNALRGIGSHGALVLVRACFGGIEFQNRHAVGG
jgi:hypothetical protein